MTRPIHFVLAAVSPLALLSACGEPAEEATEMESARTSEEAAALERAVQPGDFLDLELGARIVGPQGPEVTGRFTNEAGAFGDIRSFVACPAGMDPCDPATAPEGTVYTYVHVVYPGEDNEPDSGSGEGPDASDVEIATAFKMNRAAHGFTGNAGYSKAEVLAGVGTKADVTITCSDNGGLAWTINAGDGGDQWEQAEPITFYWQSTVPPAGPADAYAIQANRTTATGPGPYPAADETARNACTGQSTAR